MEMKEGWVLVFSSAELYQVKIAEDILKQNGVESHIVEKGDSVLPVLAEVNLYTPQEKAEKALEILQEHDLK